jgi:AcrR family transcriptional regulator
MKPTADERVPLSRDRILRAGVDLADREGLDALTMRRLAQELGVEAMTLYYYVANKDDLLSGIVDVVVQGIDLPTPGQAWRQALRTAAISAHDILVRHPWSAALFLRGEPRQGRLDYMNGILGCLREGGFSTEMTHHAYHAIDSHILGFTLWQVGILTASDDLTRTAADFRAQLDDERFPHLAEHVDWHLADHPQETSEFEFGLDLILDGLERLRDREREGN